MVVVSGTVGASCSAPSELDVAAEPVDSVASPAVPRLSDEPDFVPPVVDVEINVVDETGNPVPGATAITGDGVVAADAEGRILIGLDQATLAVIVADGFLDEPVLIGPTSAAVTVPLLARRGPDGMERVSMHFAGDFMLGRRYLDPGPDRIPLVNADDDGESARNVVRGIAPLFGAADISSVNFESVIGELSFDEAYPGKRFLLQSPPIAVAALDELGVDVATLGNNHSNDWQLPGVVATLDHLAAAGIAAPGAGATSEEARRPAVLSAGPYTVGFLSYTTVTGDYVNDSLPTADEPAPADLAGADRWQYDTRSFEFVDATGATIVPPGGYRPGDAWQTFRSLENELDEATVAALWAALSAEDAYPELQDWVARRGHSGAAWYRSAAVKEDVAALRAAGADLVVVQIHGGFQFAEVASSFLATSARAAVDAGADLVVGHHPHVLQGFEWYNGRLIAHSLGNFVFDQDFLATFPTVVLRTVYEGDRLIEAKVYPAVLDAYQPEAVTGAGARLIQRMLGERSTAVAGSARLADGRVGTVVAESAVDVRPAAVVPAPGGALVLAGDLAPMRAAAVALGADGVAEIAAAGLVDPARIPAGVELGRDLLGWGAFDDVTADGSSLGGVHWALGRSGSAALRTAEAPDGINTFLQLTSRESYTDDVVVRPVARVGPAEHRIFAEDGTPLDQPSSYSLRASVRVEGNAEPYLRLDAYHFDDTDPTRDPESDLVTSTRVPIEVVADGDWHRVTVDIPIEAVRRLDRATINSVMVYLGLPPPSRGEVRASFDDVAFLEWRAPWGHPDGARVAADAVRGPPGASITLYLG